MPSPKNLSEAKKYFARLGNCRNYLISRRWPGGIACPQCGSTAVYLDGTRDRWECKTRHAKRTFTFKTGTIFEDSALGLDKWLMSIWMAANSKGGVSTHDLARAIGVTQKTAWLMLLRIRMALQNDGDAGTRHHPDK